MSHFVKIIKTLENHDLWIGKTAITPKLGLLNLVTMLERKSVKISIVLESEFFFSLLIIFLFSLLIFRPSLSIVTMFVQVFVFVFYEIDFSRKKIAEFVL